MPEVKIRRCAIYTRKSTEEGLDRDFNSLDAQREAGENFIASQKMNGWQLLPDHYDDGGYSGGNTDRPALKQLMTDVVAGKIDTIVVYKMDRLSRSLLDFMNMSEFFEKHNVSFVSVTQDINTSTSSGRMMLNILMTFAEYERSIITERIIDKIAGAKRRGKFCGGCPILGYSMDNESKKLVIIPAEAQIVRETFDLYNQLGSAKEVARVLKERGYHSKEWTTRKGKIRPGAEIKPDLVYRILNNPLYVGRVSHKEKTYPGEHQAIISQDVWERTRELLESNLASSGRKNRTMDVPFKGLLRCGHCGGAMGITYTRKKNARYYYYLCRDDSKRIDSVCPLVRVAAGDLDRVVLRKLGELLSSPTILAKTQAAVANYYAAQADELRKQLVELEKIKAKLRASSGQPDIAADELTQLREQFRKVEGERATVEAELKEITCSMSGESVAEVLKSLEMLWGELFPAERYRLAHLLVGKITLFTDKMIIDVKTDGLKSLFRELHAVNPNDEVVENPDAEIISITVPIRLKHQANRRTLLLAGEELAEDQAAAANENLILGLAKAHVWFEMMLNSEVRTVQELADKVNVERSYVTRILNLVNLAPGIQSAILDGREPDGLTLKRLRNELPLDWRRQEGMFVS